MTFEILELRYNFFYIYHINGHTFSSQKLKSIKHKPSHILSWVRFFSNILLDDKENEICFSLQVLLEVTDDGLG